MKSYPPSSAPDLFSNDYLSLSTDPVMRALFLKRVHSGPRLFGSTGARISNGSSEDHNALERQLEKFYNAESALTFSSGFNANMAFFSCVPQPTDVIIYDQLMHMSAREGFRASACRESTYKFAHNSVSDFRKTLERVLKARPDIISGKATAFIVVESLYSMDGDFCPLREIIEIIEELVPAGHYHIYVDEAHTTALCGPNGSGYVSLLGLNDRVQSVVHTFGKAFGFHGGVLLSSPLVHRYIIGFANHFIFTTSMPYIDVFAMRSALDVVASERGQQLRDNLTRLCRYAQSSLSKAFEAVSPSLLVLGQCDGLKSIGDVQSPIIPILSPLAMELADFLRTKGYGASYISIPIAPSPRIRMIVHARNTEEEIDTFAGILVQWAKDQVVPSSREIPYHDRDAPRARL
ncbi:hypothetical protein HYDPIDRAFT_174881 [Hydnomerulius pinastri MD-312]|nr:hypothetical protein HYDPIDRAFT_174881 [Hydnomerulius pinastri MD-312]